MPVTDRQPLERYAGVYYDVVECWGIRLNKIKQANGTQINLHQVFKTVKIIQSENEIGGEKAWGERAM